jgi:hypothetical protein
MLTYTIEHNRGASPFVHKTLYIEGTADPSEREKLNTIFFDALGQTEHLVMNLDRLSEFDCTFVMLTCFLHKTARLLKKRLTVQGCQLENFICEYEETVQWKEQSCKLANTSTCYLWECIFRKVPHYSGNDPEGKEVSTTQRSTEMTISSGKEQKGGVT